MNTNQDPRYDNFLERVGFARRFAAWLIDNLLVSFVATILVFSVGTKLLTALHIDDETEYSIFSDSEADDNAEELLQALNVNPNMLFALTMLNSLTMLLYSTLELFTGASLGKRFMGIVIGSDEGEPASKALLARRWGLRYASYGLALIPATSMISSILSFLITCGCLLVLGSQRQALHDMAVHSAIYYREDMQAQATHA